MKAYEVIIPVQVLSEIMDQVVLIAFDSPINAYEWEQRLMSAIRQIGEHPGYAKDEHASSSMGLEVRKMVFERTYLVFFTVDEARQVIQLLHFRHGARASWTGRN